ncbi:unnamed protein product [Durusdinium trenchii]|uniref:Uncharacterized protein n=2 Tax=Durusdinium trenchii TaxID=1381693 RepID=A0ABP0RM62_9DINO
MSHTRPTLACGKTRHVPPRSARTSRSCSVRVPATTCRVFGANDAFGATAMALSSPARRTAQSAPVRGAPKAKPKAKGLVRPKARASSSLSGSRRVSVATQTELRLPSTSLRSVMRSGKSVCSELEDGSPMPLNLVAVNKTESGGSGMSGEASDDPHTPVRRHSWELSSLDPSTWPVFGITNDGFGITTKEGQLDVEKSASFGFDRPFDPAKLESILEGSMPADASFGMGEIRLMRSELEETLARAQEENESFRHLCWDLISLGRNLEEGVGFQEPPSHEELLEEARRCLELARERLELRERLQEAVPEMEVPTPEGANLSRSGSLKLARAPALDVAPGSCTLPSRNWSPPPERRLTASCSVPALPWSACCPVARAPAPSVPVQTWPCQWTPQMMSRPQSCAAQVSRFSSEPPYPCEPVTRSVSPLREPDALGPAPLALGPSPSPLVLSAPPSSMPPRPVATPLAVPPAAAVAQRHYRQTWIGSWIKRSTSYEAPPQRFTKEGGTYSHV